MNWKAFSVVLNHLLWLAIIVTDTTPTTLAIALVAFLNATFYYTSPE